MGGREFVSVQWQFKALIILIILVLTSGLYLGWSQKQPDPETHLEGFDYDLLERWNRSAEYDSIMQYLKPRYEKWAESAPVNIASTIKYYVNAQSDPNPESIDQMLNEMEALIAQKLGAKDLSLHFIYHQKALNWLTMGLWDEAKALIEVSAKIAELSTNYPKLFSDINSIASFLSIQYGELEKGLRYNDIADSILIAEFGPDFFGRIATLNNYGILYESLGKHHDALEAGLRTVQIVQEHYARNHENLPKALNGLGLKYYALGRIDEAIETFNEALALNEEFNKDINLFDVYLNISSAYAAKWDYDNAFNFLELANTYLSEESNFYPPHKVELLMRKASLMSDLGKTEEAREITIELKELLNRLFEAEDYRLRKTYAMFYMVDLKQKNFKGASESLEKYMRIIKNYIGEDSEEWAHGLAWKADLYREQGLLDSAYAYNNMALDLYKNLIGAQHHYYIETQLQLIHTLISLAEHKAADSILNSILLLGLNTKKDQSRFVIPPYDSIYKHIHLRSVLEHKLEIKQCNDNASRLNCLLEKSVYYRYLGHEFDRVLQQYGGYKSRDDLRSGSERIFKEAISNCYDLYIETGENHWKDLALEYAERTRGLKLQEIMRDKLARVGGGIPDSLRAIENELILFKNNLEEQLNSISDQEDPKTYAAVKREIANLDKKHAEFIAGLEKNFPRYYDLKYNVELANVESIRTHLLNKNRGLIQFSFIGETVFVNILGKHTNELLKIRLPEDIEEIVRLYYEGLQNRDFHLLSEHGEIVFEKIFLPIIPFIEHFTELIVVPDSWLYYINLESLPMHGFAEDYLIERFRFQYLYSPTVTIQNKKYKPARRKLLNWVGFVPGFDVNDMEGSDLSFVAQPFASKVAEHVAEEFKGKLFKGKEANRASFSESAGAGKLLHIGTHAVADDSDPLNSYMVLSGDGQSYDLLKASEIFNKEIQSNCAVLTACQTAVGKIKGGEGMVSLARAFAHAGCPNMVVTLWSVDDEQTANIIDGFYQQIKKGQRLDEALYQAKLAYISSARGELRHPFYWAGLVYFGTDSYLKESGLNGLWYILGVSGLLAAFFYFRYSASKTNSSAN